MTYMCAKNITFTITVYGVFNRCLKMEKLFRSLIIFSLLPLAVFAKTGNTTLEFVANKGQWDGPFLYKSLSGAGIIYLEPKGVTYQLEAVENSTRIHGVKEGHLPAPQVLRFHTYKVHFENALQAEVSESKQQPHYYNYFLGNDKNKWKSGIHPSHVVDYRGIYKNIDLHIASADADLKYDFIVHAGGNAEDIKLRFEGTDGLSLENGNLQVKTSVGTLKELKPYAYQYIDNEKVEVACKYRLSGNTVSYAFPKGYNDAYTLVIDPTVVFSTYTGSTADNFGFTATYDDAGNFYAGGITSGNGYPTSTGAYDVSYNGGGTCGGNAFSYDMTITKFNPTGTSIVYSTYIGGGENDQPHSMIVDGNGDLVISGRTCSINYPTTGGAYSTNNSGGSDIIVTTFNPTGTALIGSTYIGGSADDGMNISGNFGVFNTSLKHSYGDDSRSEVIVDNNNNVYVASCTKSANFPVVSPHQGSLQGAQDGVIVKLNPTLTTLLWSTFIGGNDNDAAYALTLNRSQSSLYVSGGTASNNFPSTSGTFSSSYNGGIADGFILKFQNSGAYPLLRGTFIGGASYDQSYGVQTDTKGFVYAMGQSLGNGVSVFNATYSNPNSSQFVIKLDSNLNTRIYSTVFGSGNSGSVNITPTAFLVDTCENVYISGWGGTLAGSGGSTSGMPTNLGTPAPALLTNTTTGEDFYFIVLQKNASALLFGAFFGSSSKGDHVDGGTSRFDKNGVIYQAMCGDCGGNPKNSVPTTAGAYSTTNGNANCNLVALKIAMNLGSVDAKFSITPPKLCVGESVTFTNSSSNATNYEWSFGDGSPTFSGMTPPPKTYNTAGNYTIRLIVTNPNACFTSDTAYVVVQVSDSKIDAGFTATVIDTCAPYTASFTNTSTHTSVPAAGTVYTWDFGDGTTHTGTTPPNKNYSKSGTYTIKLTMANAGACNDPDTALQTISFKNDSVKAAFDVPELNCVSDSFRVTNRAVNALTYLWNFGDGKTSTGVAPSHKFDTIGTFKVTMYAFNPTTCNRVDSQTRYITLNPSPEADFSYTPVVPEVNVPYYFTNKSKGAVEYFWNFGDGASSTVINPEHTYKRSGSYSVCLVAMNKEGCTDTVCKPLLADVQPLADIPNAFSPNGDGKNDVLYVRGYGIETMNLRIYNRWGEKVFESNDVDYGWDGTAGGKPQEIEAYAFVLNVTFTDGTTFNKKGNITLLR